MKRILSLLISCTLLLSLLVIDYRPVLADAPTTNVPQICITTDNGAGDTYQGNLTKDMGYVTAKISISAEDGSDLFSDGDDTSSQIKVRGNATSTGAKKPYNIKLSSKVNLFGFGKSKKWVLLADCFDPTLMRNAIAFDMAQELGLDCTPNYKRVEVTLDGNYLGAYLLCEKIEANSNRVDIDTANGDFLFEMESTTRTEEGNNYFSSPLGGYFRLREPDEDECTDEELARVTQVVNEAETILQSGSYNDISLYWDLDSISSYYLLCEFMKSVDVHHLSMYWYYKDGKIYGGPAWDFDLSSGNMSTYYDAMWKAWGYSGENYSEFENASAALNTYFKYFVNHSQFRQLVYNKYIQHKSFFDSLYADNGYIENQLANYRNVFNRNYLSKDEGGAGWIINSNYGWYVDGTYYQCAHERFDTYDENLNYLKNWLQGRNVWISNYLQKEANRQGDNHLRTRIENASVESCTADGYTGDVVCIDCGERISSGKVIPALGHQWDDGVVTKQPTALECGVKTFTCSVCGESRTESIAKLQAEPVQEETTRPVVQSVLGAKIVLKNTSFTYDGKQKKPEIKSVSLGGGETKKRY